MVNDNMSLEQLRQHFVDILDDVNGDYTRKISRVFTDEWNSLSIPTRNTLSEYLKDFPGRRKKEKTLSKSFDNVLRTQAVADFWINEVGLVKKGQGTFNWDTTQQKSILENGIAYYKDPITGKEYAFQGHHMFNVDNFPAFAGDYRNIQPLYGNAQSHGTLHNNAHNGCSSNPTYGYYDEITNDRYKISDKLINKMFGDTPKEGEMTYNGYPPVIHLTKISDEVKELA